MNNFDYATGLSEAEVQARRAQGQGNDIEFASSRTYGDIIRHNVFNFINIVIFTIGAVLVLLGRPRDAFFGAGLIVLNVVIGIFQEVRAKRKLDQIAVLARPQIAVIRDGVEAIIDPAEIVLGDIVVIHPGDQMVVDGEVVGDGQCEVDESLLTGESELVRKQAGDAIYSGSFCVTGTARYEAQRVGADSYANKLTASARQFQVSTTPLQQQIGLVIRILMIWAAFYGFLLFLSSWIYDMPLVRSAQTAAVITGLVPNGLLFMIILSYALGALRMAGEGALVQQQNAVESLSHIDVLCTDKTGTLTANKLRSDDVYAVDGDEVAFKSVLGAYARNVSAANATSDAIAAGLSGDADDPAPVPVAEVPFSSARKWSALVFDGADDAELHGAYVLGALEMLQPHLVGVDDRATAIDEQTAVWASQGRRVLLMARSDMTETLEDADEPSLPPLTALGLVTLSDELRPNVNETIAGFHKAGIALKVISGDSPDTVVALARQAGLPGEIESVSGPDLDDMGDAEFAQTAETASVFGRITPEQKERLVDALRENGHYVAMIGDGVNDVLSLKKADVGVAMQSGSGATRGVADIVLLNDSFAALLPAMTEGQRIVYGMGDILRLFLSRTFSVALIIAAASIVRLPFPTAPSNEFLYSLIAVGIPTFFLAIWAKSAHPPKQILLHVLPFVLPANIALLVFGTLLYTGFFFAASHKLMPVEVTPQEITQYETFAGFTLAGENEFKYQAAGLVGRTALTFFANLAGILLVFFVAPPIRLFVAAQPLSDDKRPGLLAVGLLVLLFIVYLVEPLRSYFGLLELRNIDLTLITAVAVVWAVLLRVVWKRRFLQRFLQVDFQEEGIATESAEITVT